MRSTATPRFWRLFKDLPVEIQEHAKRSYELWRLNPQHSSLHFKRLAGAGHRFSVRIGIHYRAIGWRSDDGGVEWVWIGSHADYDRLLG